MRRSKRASDTVIRILFADRYWIIRYFPFYRSYPPQGGSNRCLCVGSCYCTIRSFIQESPTSSLFLPSGQIVFPHMTPVRFALVRLAAMGGFPCGHDGSFG